ncbi:MAG: hypothetical protein K2X39_06080 [Silvanigrellaceae bacterium]|nr:hypothetical protein [Silvanigrellaceae bacterium]
MFSSKKDIIIFYLVLFSCSIFTYFPSNSCATQEEDDEVLVSQYVPRFLTIEQEIGIADRRKKLWSQVQWWTKFLSGATATVVTASGFNGNSSCNSGDLSADVKCLTNGINNPLAVGLIAGASTILTGFDAYATWRSSYYAEANIRRDDLLREIEDHFKKNSVPGDVTEIRIVGALQRDAKHWHARKLGGYERN